MGNARSIAAAVGLVVAGAILAVLYPYSLFYTSRETECLIVRATLALLGLLLGAFISSAGIALLAASKVRGVEAEAAGEEQEGR
jgi:hypothetical protein